MSRIISTDGPGKARHHHRRTIAEAMRRLSRKPRFDDEAKDLSAAIVFSLLEIADSVDRTTEAWEKRDYYMKAERFREQWRWVEPLTDELSAVLYEARWQELPGVLAGLAPHFADIRVKKLTRNPGAWKGAYARFMEDS
jgi:hypothetical protein